MPAKNEIEDWVSEVRTALLLMDRSARSISRDTGIAHHVVGRFLNGEGLHAESFVKLAKFAGYELGVNR